MKQDVMISMCDKTGIMARPWAENGHLCICVDIQHSIRATAKNKHKVEKYEGGGRDSFCIWRCPQLDTIAFCR